MRVLLDTHVLLWALVRPAKLSAAVLKRIEAAEVYVSAASIWEIGIKAAIGKLKADPREILEAVEPAGFLFLPISGEHAVEAAKLPPLHKDPFDRMLVAQASVEPMILLTDDSALRNYGSFVTII
jgi:PIN domain nuclease of toxin-antitoxin system